MPLRAADSAVTCAANGVDLREPLKPTVPADSQAMTLPERSVRETIVLLKLALMWAWPNGTFFFTLRRPERPFLASAMDYLETFFLLAICALRGPLRVRALVLVR